MAKICVIFGTRPEAIKLAPVVLALREDRRFDCRVCVTGQHREMLDQVLEAFDLRPETDLDIMEPGQSLAALTSRSLDKLDGYLAREMPDLVLVQGDTTTVLCAALAAFYRRLPVGHVEAGLRTGDLEAPWPEEANRVLVSRLAALHFAPTARARQNLLDEGTPSNRIHVTGNTVIDALFHALEKNRKAPPVIPGLPSALQRGLNSVEGSAGRSSAARPAGFVLITGHRRENFGDGFESICRAVADLAARFPEVHFVYPVHLNPNVREPVFRLLNASAESAGLGAGRWNNVHLIEPVPYLAFVAMMERATLILTDSGGIQEEAPSLGKPVLVMREKTERPEALATGLVTLVGTGCENILAAATRLLQAAAAVAKPPGSSPVRPGQFSNPYGDGRAAARIVAACVGYLSSKCLLLR